MISYENLPVELSENRHIIEGNVCLSLWKQPEKRRILRLLQNLRNILQEKGQDRLLQLQKSKYTP